MNFSLSSSSIYLGIAMVATFFCSCTSEKDKSGVTIAAAASTQFVVEALSEGFSRSTGIPTAVIIGSSGKLTAQISEGAPYDVFLAADEQYTKTLSSGELTVAPPMTFAYGSLVIWTARENLQPDMNTLLSDDVRHIAIANPATAPYGLSAMEVLEITGLRAAVQPKLVFGESIAQVNQFVSGGAAEVGFTALSVVKSSRLESVGAYTKIADSLYTPIEQSVAVIRQADEEKLAAARAFQAYLFSEEGRRILRKFGYRLPK